MNDQVMSIKNELCVKIGMDRDQLEKKIALYISLIDDTPTSILKYHHQSESQIKFYQELKKILNSTEIQMFHQITMLELMNKFSIRVKKILVPPSIIEIFKLEFERILALIKNDSIFIFDWSNDSFAKDMGICTFRLIPTGAQLVEISGVSRRIVFSDFKKVISNLFFFARKTGGFKPYYEIHTHSGNLGDFNPEGWNRCYVRIGELLKLNPEIKGMQGGSWFYDPALSKISPRLAYLSEVPCANGAKVFFVQEEGKSSSALSKSESRKQSYVDGKYTPKAYLLVWPRENLIRFSEENKDLL
jgi:hypothetical protein